MAEGQIVVLDESKMLEKILSFPNQLEKTWSEYWIKDLGSVQKSYSNVIIAGMGGSGIAGHLVNELSRADSSIPIIVWQDYGLPQFVSKNSLVIAVSFSGDTEEIIDVVKKSKEREANTICITTGNHLDELSQIHGFLAIKIDNTGLPRTAIGSLYGALLVIMAKLGFINISEKGFFQALEELKKVIKEKTFPSKAEDLALSLSNKLPLIFAAYPLTAVAKRWQNQMNENAKLTSVIAVVPEACHNQIVGIEFPVPEKLFAIFLESSFAFSRNAARKKIIQNIFSTKDIDFVPLSVKSGSMLAEQLLLIHFGDLLSYYLAGVNGIDPTPIETIETLKTELAKL